MDRYVVAGNPIAHSQSPFIHTEFARQTGQAMDYGRELFPLDGFTAAVRALAESGAKGCNVTVPFKFEAYRASPRPSARARLAQAANVLRFDAEGWFADNTDGVGLVNDIERNAGVALVARPAATAGATTLRAQPLNDCGAAFDVVVNASASSLGGGAIPVAPEVLAPGALALDMMYGAAAQPFLAWAAAHGARGRDGLGMLVEQAAVAFELFRGVGPETAPVLAALRARMDAASKPAA